MKLNQLIGRIIGILLMLLGAIVVFDSRISIGIILVAFGVAFCTSID